MNYVNIMGGLGNQLFQYTFSKYLEKINSYPVVLYTGFYDMDFRDMGISARDCSLDRYNTRYISTNEHITCDKVITEESFDPDVIADNSFFNGYWQDINFYSKISHLIHADLKLKPEYISDEIKKIAHEMRGCESVAVHVRRKDYLNVYNKDTFYELSLDYYVSAVNLIAMKLNCTPVLYIFSDDYDYIKTNMSNFCGYRTILMEPRKDYEDLYLMTQTRHHIIANSTFSWWGAVLSEYIDGITIAPRHWFKDRRDPDLYPDNWVIMSNQIPLDKISVIIPAYNVNKYIDRCLKSIEMQTYDISNLEIILINDSSTDDTLAHLEAIEAKYPDQVILINFENNCGQGAARNVGLSYATGKYVTFIDSDDLIDVSMLYKMAIKAEKYDCDIVECGNTIFSKDTDIKIVNDLPEPYYLNLTNNDSRKKLIINTCSKTAVWGKLYRRDFIEGNELRFIEKLVFEDIQFSGLVMFLASSYYRINETLYHYYSNSDGTVFSSYRKERVHQEAIVTEKYIAELYDRDILENILTQFGNELSIYCTTKSFIDPLTLLLNSDLGLSELSNEISYFKNKLLNIFPTAASLYYIRDEYGICDLAVYLLKSQVTLTERLFGIADVHSNILINLSDDIDRSTTIYDMLKSHYPDLADYSYINVSYSHFLAEHLLLKHAIQDKNTLIISSCGYLSSEIQINTDKTICQILKNYPDNQIIIMMNSLYYDESEECLLALSDLFECIKNHINASILLFGEETYNIVKTLLPQNDIYLMSIRL